MPPNADEFTIYGDTPVILGPFWVAIVAINKTKAVRLEIVVGPFATTEPQRFELRPGEHVVVNGWDIQVASIDPGPREVVIYVIPGPGAPSWLTLPAATASSSTPTSSGIERESFPAATSNVYPSPPG